MLDTKGNAKIKHMMVGIPTVTHWGMANLLTDEKITLDEDKLRVEGILTDGTDNREKILKINEPTAKAVQYKELNSLDREKRAKNILMKK